MQTSILLNTDNPISIRLKSKNAKSPNQSLKFVIDTGASVSLIKISSLNSYNTNSNIIKLKDIFPNTSMNTCGKNEVDLKYHNHSFTSKFQLIDDSTNVPFDGLIGMNFFVEHACNIDFKNFNISMSEFSIKIPFQVNSFDSLDTKITNNAIINNKHQSLEIVDSQKQNFIYTTFQQSKSQASNNQLYTKNNSTRRNSLTNSKKGIKSFQDQINI